jgi:caudovirus prohead protease|nr:MAG TPA: major capsid protein [Caudoviricetes sp.]
MNKLQYDFSGWATRNDILCSDGKTIKKNAFIENDGSKVPLVWNHQHDSVDEVLGHAYLENRDSGVYAYCKFNDTDSGKAAKQLVKNGDIESLSIYANKLKTNNNNVFHGCIREVSLVLAGANPGAYIDNIVMHSDGSIIDDEAIIYNNSKIDVVDDDKNNAENVIEDKQDNNQEANKSEEINHSEETKNEKEDKEVDNKKTSEENETVDYQKMFDELTDEQKDMVATLIGMAVEQAEENNETEENDEEGEENMKHNIFDNDTNEVLQHAELFGEIIRDAKKTSVGSLKESFLQHAAINNIDGISKLFPDATELNKVPKMIERNREWVDKVMSEIKHTPFSRVKTTFGKMTEPEARAKGYIKGNEKTDIKMSILNRVTTPTTVYIKNEIDRDDVVDITDFDVVAWQKAEMRKQLDKDLALSILLGDGRELSDPNKINEQNIRPIVSDDDLYTIKYEVKDNQDFKSTKENDSLEKGIIRAAIKARKNYKGSGRPTLFTTEDMLTKLLLIEDTNGRLIYEDVDKLARTLRVESIVTIPEMEGEKYKDIYGVIVNLADYTMGADKGGSINMFDDFDIDFNQLKYLIETRASGALTVPHSAIVLKKAAV